MDEEDRGPLTGVLDDLEESGRDDAVSIGEVLDAFSHRSVGALITLFALIASLPVIGDFPGMAILTGSLIIVAIVQSFFGGGGIWAPEFVRRQETSRERLEKAVEKSRPFFRWVEHLLKPRVRILVEGVLARRAIVVTAGLLALSFYPLVIVPFGVNVAALGVLAFGLGLMAGDGLMVLFAYGFTAATAYLLLAVV